MQSTDEEEEAEDEYRVTRKSRLPPFLAVWMRCTDAIGFIQ
jgi:hypothetical protein